VIKLLPLTLTSLINKLECLWPTKFSVGSNKYGNTSNLPSCENRSIYFYRKTLKDEHSSLFCHRINEEAKKRSMKLQQVTFFVSIFYLGVNIIKLFNFCS
jgi:hypothetical protein